MKIYCARCSLYLGQTDNGGIECQIICPICEDATARTRSILTNEPVPTEYPNEVYFSWLSHVLHRHSEDEAAVTFIRLTHERRETDFFVFPAVEKMT